MNNYCACIVTFIIAHTSVTTVNVTRMQVIATSSVIPPPQKKEKERRVVFMKPLWVRDAAKIILV